MNTKTTARPMKDPTNWLYPEIAPYNAGWLKVSELHELYYEESGNPTGKPAIFLHGGPGGGTDARHRRFWDPTRYRIILMDQRGCGKSTPHASLEQNTTWDLVEDCEKLREHLGIRKWQVLGGSWGSTLALAYAETHPESCTALVLRGIFLVRKKELDWFYQGSKAGGIRFIFPDEWERYVGLIPPSERGDLIAAYHKRLTSADPAVRLEAARAWSIWEASVSTLLQDPNLMAKFAVPETALAFARIESHYFMNRAFMDPEDQLLRNIGRIRHIPAVIVQGRYDVVCPMESAWELHKAWPEADFIIVPDAGHSAFEPGNCRAQVAATDRFASL